MRVLVREVPDNLKCVLNIGEYSVCGEIETCYRIDVNGKLIFVRKECCEILPEDEIVTEENKREVKYLKVRLFRNQGSLKAGQVFDVEDFGGEAYTARVDDGKFTYLAKRNCEIIPEDEIVIEENKQEQETTKGRKDDGGKIRAGVLADFANALKAVAVVGDYGCEKYERSNWLKVDNALERYTDAFWRHLLEHSDGEAVDKESGLPHINHALWNLAAVVELMERAKNEI